VVPLSQAAVVLASLRPASRSNARRDRQPALRLTRSLSPRRRSSSGAAWRARRTGRVSGAADMEPGPADRGG